MRIGNDVSLGLTADHVEDLGLLSNSLSDSYNHDSMAMIRLHYFWRRIG